MLKWRTDALQITHVYDNTEMRVIIAKIIIIILTKKDNDNSINKLMQVKSNWNNNSINEIDYDDDSI